VEETEDQTEQPEAEREPGIAGAVILSGIAPALRWVARVLREAAETIIPAVVIALLINLFLAQATQVEGQSMEPNLHTHQRVVVEKVTYRLFHGPRRGDIVVLDLPNQDDMLIKRVIGLPGDTIEVRSGQVFIDGELLEEPWAPRIDHGGGSDYGPQTISPLHVFVLGDNRGSSNDSRSFGAVYVDDVVGRAWFSYWPVEHVGVIQ
jgi:signal peptidase I